MSSCDSYQRGKHAALVLCVVMVANALFSGFAMAAAGATSHHQPHSSEAGVAHNIMAHGEHSLDCCTDEPDSCPAGMTICANVCNQSVSALFQQAISYWQLSDTLSANLIINIPSIPPSRQFKPPRA